jgi:hypothetical protein
MGSIIEMLVLLAQSWYAVINRSFRKEEIHLAVGTTAWNIPRTKARPSQARRAFTDNLGDTKSEMVTFTSTAIVIETIARYLYSRTLVTVHWSRLDIGEGGEAIQMGKGERAEIASHTANREGKWTFGDGKQGSV